MKGLHPNYRELLDVEEFQDKFDVPMPDRPVIPSREITEFRERFLQEELDEFKEAIAAGDLHKAADALVDLEYVLKGTVLMMGLGHVWPMLWNEVQDANMRKVRTYRAEDSKRGSTFDVVKPAGWVGPNFDAILGPRTCRAVQHSDQMVCEPCGLRWDANDGDEPRCPLGSK